MADDDVDEGVREIVDDIREKGWRLAGGAMTHIGWVDIMWHKSRADPTPMKIVRSG
jgi:hypothetical protein